MLMPTRPCKLRESSCLCVLFFNTLFIETFSWDRTLTYSELSSQCTNMYRKIRSTGKNQKTKQNQQQLVLESLTDRLTTRVSTSHLYLHILQLHLLASFFFLFLFIFYLESDFEQLQLYNFPRGINKVFWFWFRSQENGPKHGHHSVFKYS